MAPLAGWWRYLAPLVVIAIIAVLPVPTGLESHTWLYFAVFTGVIVGLILEPVPGAVVAMIGISIIAVLSPWLLFSPEQLAQDGFKFTANSLSWAVSGFSNSVIWLIFAAFMFGTGYEKTGLGRRIALMLVKKMGHRTLFLGYAVMFSELILAPVTPSNSARGAGIIYPIIRNLPPLYNSQPNSASSRSIGSYIMWMGIVADCVTSAIFLTAMAPNLLLIGLMPWSPWVCVLFCGVMGLVGALIGLPMFFEVGVVILIPVVLFAVAVFLSFSTGTSWGTFAILVPIATGMFAAGTNLEMMIISVSAVLAGAVCGDHISPISDTTIMSSSGAQSNHINHVQTQMQYAMVVVAACVPGYLIAGFTENWLITLVSSLAILTAALLYLRRRSLAEDARA